MEDFRRRPETRRTDDDTDTGWCELVGAVVSGGKGEDGRVATAPGASGLLAVARLIRRAQPPKTTTCFLGVRGKRYGK